MEGEPLPHLIRPLTDRATLPPLPVSFTQPPTQDPGKAPLDLRFFELATAPPFSFVVEDVKVVQRVDLFEEGDGLDEERGKVYVKRLRFG